MRSIALLAAVFGMMWVLSGCDKPAEPQNSTASTGPVYLPDEEEYLPPSPPPQPQGSKNNTTYTHGTTNTSGSWNYTVQKGDTLFKIAREQLGGNSRVHEIRALNPEIGSGDVLRIGQVLKMPAK